MTAASTRRGWHFDKDTLPAHLGWEELPPEEELYDYLLDIDIKEFGSPVLVDVLPTATSIPKDVVLQVRRVKNVSVPESSWKSGTFESSKNDVLRYYFTDGHSSISGCDMNSNFRLNRGAKVLLHKDCPIECGFIIMDKKYLTVYGGGIPEAAEQKPTKAGGDDSAIARYAPKFAELLNTKRTSKPKTDYRLPKPIDNGNISFDNDFHQETNTQAVQYEQPVRGSQSERGTTSGSNQRSMNDGEPRQKTATSGRQENLRPRTVPENAKGRGNFQCSMQTEQPQKMYDEYKHSVTSNLTFSKSFGTSQRRDGGNRNSERGGRRGGQSSQSDRNRNQRREPDNDYRYFKNDEGQGGHNSRGRDGRGLGRGSSRGGNRGGRGQSNSRNFVQGTRGSHYQQNTNYSIPSGPQFNAQSDFDFPTLGDAMTGMSLH